MTPHVFLVSVVTFFLVAALIIRDAGRPPRPRP